MLQRMPTLAIVWAESDGCFTVSTALSAACKLIGPDLINAVLPTVTSMVKHPKELVRKKAVMALQRFQQLDPHHEGPLAGSDIDKHFRQALCDKVSLGYPGALLGFFPG